MFLLSACTVGPDHERPQVLGARADWSRPPNDGEELGAAALDLEPWRKLGDPLLVELVERAVAANRDVAQADARLREARALRDVARGGRVPEGGVKASASQVQLSKNGEMPFANIPGIDRTFSLYDVGFDASWELDLWGGTRRSVEAAAGRLAAAEAQAREARLRVVAETVRTYADLRGAQADARVLGEEAEAQRRIAGLLGQLHEAGEVARSDAADADAQARRSEAEHAGARARIVASENALALLTANPPEALSGRLATAGALPVAPRLVAAGLRSDMLRRRPDVVAAEAQLRAANADVGVETARMFPHLSLVGGIGQQSRDPADLTSGGSTRFSIGPSFSWPILSLGRIKARIRAADARTEAAAAVYEAAVLGAMADSETALNRYATAVAVAEDLAMARDRAAVSRDLAARRYRAGEDSLIQSLTAASRFHAAERAATDAAADALRAHAALVKALGGGWEPPLTSPPVP
ncbi:MAG TPA: efflux transporter outer membrane subunit [Novosphingobium sp.]|nr:efflux transporter outer membrane subunit [Novosphingobium sp.]